MFWKRERGKGKALLLYSSVQDIIATHSLLQKRGLEVSLVPPPAEVAIGCDLAVQIALQEEEYVRGMMGEGIILPGKVHHLAGEIQPVKSLTEICEVWPGFLMASSNNIKVTIDQKTHEIVNISGGGCPDIPYVASRLLGCSVEKCPEPIEIGTSLCTYMVQLAVDRLRREVGTCWPL